MRSFINLIAFSLLSFQVVSAETIATSQPEIVPEKADSVPLAYSSDPIYHHFTQGLDCQSKGLTDQAVTHYKKVLESYPQCLPAQYNLGICLESLKQWDQAIVAFEQAAKVDPYSQPIYRHLIYLANKSGNQKKSRQYYATYLKL